MSFSGATTIEQMNSSMNAMLLLHSSCQAIIEATIQQVDSSWYDVLDQELGEAENLVIGWRQNGYLYFHQDILDEITFSGQLFINSQKTIDTLFQQLENEFSEATKLKLIDNLSSLVPPITELTDQISSYQSKLQTFEVKLQKPHDEMNQTIAQVQAQEQKIQNEIDSINNQIKLLQQQILADRKAIAAAKKARSKGIIETVFGIILAPFSLGASLVLAGIGVATISEAEDKIDSMQTAIGKYQQSIVGDQQNLSDDQKIIVTLNGLSMSTEVAINDLSLISNALDQLRLSWGVLKGELNNEITQLTHATTAEETVVSKAWFEAACAQWTLIVNHAIDLNQRTISSTNVTIG